MQGRNSRGWVVSLTAAVLALMLLGTLQMLADDSSGTEWKVPSRAAKKSNPIPADDKSVAAGKAIFETQCLSCHGSAGKGDGPAAAPLDPKPKDLSSPEVTALTDGAMFYMITTGKTPMPTFEKLISEDDRWNAINYVRTLQPKAPAKTQPATTQSSTKPSSP